MLAHMSEIAPSTYVAVVDDDENLCRSMVRFLRTSGFQPTSYLSAEEFLADSDRARFDCLLLDIRLDGMSGIELSKRLKASGSTTPVIFITANDRPDVHDQALRAGCVAYLTKSDPGEAVLAAISRAVHSS